jgi:hypothetical protein
MKTLLNRDAYLCLHPSKESGRSGTTPYHCISSCGRCRHEDGEDMKTVLQNYAYSCLHPSQEVSTDTREGLLVGPPSLHCLRAMEGVTKACTAPARPSPHRSVASRARPPWTLSFLGGCRQEDSEDMQTLMKHPAQSCLHLVFYEEMPEQRNHCICTPYLRRQRVCTLGRRGEVPEQQNGLVCVSAP